VISS